MFWLSMGVTIGALVVRKVERLVERLMPRSVASNLAQRLSEVADSLGEFAADVRSASAEREAELRRTSGLAPVRKLSGDAA